MKLTHFIFLTGLGSVFGTRIAVADSSNFSTGDRTHIDFSDTMIEGRFKAPQGFLLQGRKAQVMTQMVKLRSHWRNELRNSKSAVKSLVK